MKTELLNPCEGPKCKDSATHIIRLDSGKTIAKVCNRHLSWGKELGVKIENS